MKLLHLSDLHLNAQHRQKDGTTRMILKKNRLKAFQNALDYVWANEVNYLVIAGDLMDHMAMDYEVEKSMVTAIKPLLAHGVKVFYVTGNHDVASAAYWLTQLKNCEGFFCFDKAVPQHLTFMDTQLNKTVHFVGCGHEKVDESRQLIADFPERDDNGLWIGMAHASVLGAQQAEKAYKYLPTTLEALESKRYDYFALGHIHKRQFLKPNIAYAGSHEPMDITEIGPRGGILVEWNATLQMSTTPVDFNETQMVMCHYELDESIESTLALEDALMLHMARRKPLSQNTCVRLSLKGQSALYSELKNRALLEKMAFHIKEHLDILSLELLADEVRVACNRSAIMQDDTVLSSALALIDSNAIDERLLPGRTREEKLSWWQANKHLIEDELIQRMVKVTYEN